jgi:hypothetical protein
LAFSATPPRSAGAAEHPACNDDGEQRQCEHRVIAVDQAVQHGRLGQPCGGVACVILGDSGRVEREYGFCGLDGKIAGKSLEGEGDALLVGEFAGQPTGVSFGRIDCFWWCGGGGWCGGGENGHGDDGDDRRGQESSDRCDAHARPFLDCVVGEPPELRETA